MMGTYQQLAKLNIQSLNVAGVQVNLQQKPVRNLGVMFDRNMTMSDPRSSHWLDLCLIIPGISAESDDTSQWTVQLL